MKDIKATFAEPKASRKIPWERLPSQTRSQTLVVAFTDDGKLKIREAAKASFYASSRGTTVHGVVEVALPDYTRVRGYGKAGGYGYHKESAALGEALRDAGFTFLEDGKNFRIDGTGDSWYEETLVAAIRAVGWGDVEFGRLMV
jgi:hypothetical protein